MQSLLLVIVLFKVSSFYLYLSWFDSLLASWSLVIASGMSSCWHRTIYIGFYIYMQTFTLSIVFSFSVGR